MLSSELPVRNGLEFRTDPLPAGFPSIAATVSDPESMEPGITLFNLTQLSTSMIVAVNERGEVIWYYRHSLPGLTDIKRLRNGHLIFTDAQGAAEIDMLGNLYQRWNSANLNRNVPAFGTPLYIDNLHHEIYETTRGTFLTLSTEVREFSDYPTSETDFHAPTAPADVVGDVVIDFDTDGRILQRWSLFDVLDPYRIGYDSLTGIWNQIYSSIPEGTRDWSHANAVIEDASDDSIIVSLRHQDAIIKIDRQTGRLKWILGSPDGWGSSWAPYLLTPLGTLQWPYHQHAPMITPQGTILLFDNGNKRHRPTEDLPDRDFSRAVEYAIDEKAMQVAEVWSYGDRGEESFYSSALGDANFLPLKQNVLITDGFRITQGIPDSRWARIIEVTHTIPAQKVFELIVRDAPGSNYAGWRIYRAQRLPSLDPAQ
jgi:arylsulfate sulfotransferase